MIHSIWVFPQHDPGPAHAACPGVLPQQVVSDGPGTCWATRPVIELVADMIFAVSTLPQVGQVSDALLFKTTTSPIWLHSLQMIS